MNCPACGGANPEDAVFCGFCAAALHADAAPPPPPPPAGLESVRCAVCGYGMAVADGACPRCGTPRGHRLDPTAPLPGTYAPAPGDAGAYGVNTSGMKAGVPQELKGGWNWGAFWFTWIWGLNHKTPIMLLALLVNLVGRLVPLVGLAGFGLAIWFGVRGNEWAWQNRRFESIEQFRAVQRAWSMWVLGSAIFCGVVVAIAVAVGLASLLEPR